METYKKPVIINDESAHTVFPAVAGAFAVGVGMGLARGKNGIDTKHTQALPRKETRD
ncbi:MAG: hypothetical protein IJP68_13420 [Selenomonadaceae bacterium]|nr:hypothetical protein [Selenomonadaceae bacterium]